MQTGLMERVLTHAARKSRQFYSGGKNGSSIGLNGKIFAVILTANGKYGNLNSRTLVIKTCFLQELNDMAGTAGKEREKEAVPL